VITAATSKRWRDRATNGQAASPIVNGLDFG
jgi:hypothetical protein